MKTILRKYDIKSCPAGGEGPEADRLLRFILLRGSQEGRCAQEVFKDVREVARVSIGFKSLQNTLMVNSRVSDPDPATH